MTSASKTLKTLVIAASPATLGLRPPNVTVVAWSKVRDATWSGYELYDRLFLFPPPTPKGHHRGVRAQVVSQLRRRVEGGGELVFFVPPHLANTPDGIDDDWNEARYLFEEVTDCLIDPVQRADTDALDLDEHAARTLRGHFEKNPPTAQMRRAPSRAANHETDLTSLAGIHLRSERPVVLVGRVGKGGWLLLPSGGREGPTISLEGALDVGRALLSRADMRLSEARPSAVEVGSDSHEPSNAFIVRKDEIQVSFAGKSISFDRRNGLLVLRQLLLRQDEELSVMELSGLDWKQASTGAPVMDKVMRQGVQAEMRSIKGSHSVTDGETKRLEDLTHLARKATGLREPRTMGKESEGARKRVQKQIQRSIALFDRRLPALGEHLRKTITTGSTCVYRPGAKVHWIFGAE